MIMEGITRRSVRRGRTRKQPRMGSKVYPPASGDGGYSSRRGDVKKGTSVPVLWPLGLVASRLQPRERTPVGIESDRRPPRDALNLPE